LRTVLLTALVIGGTGPTGHFIVNGLIDRGYTVAILHTGNHEVDEIPPEVEHIHTDPYDEACLTEALANRTFDLCVAAYGRLRVVAKLMRGRCEQFISIGGQPCYVGYMNPMAHRPEGLPVPTAENALLVSQAEQDEKGYRIVRTEQALFELQPKATHFRYPVVYGPYQALPREWCIVKRILDGRPHIILPDDGLSLLSVGYAENLAHALLLAVDQPGKAQGEIFNCCDSQTLTLRQMVEIIAEGLSHQWRIVSMPYELAIPARPLIMQPLTTHRLMDISKLQTLLGYDDIVKPQDALQRTAQWLVDNPLDNDAWQVKALEDPFDYAAEDKLIKAWDTAMASMPDIDFDQRPGYTMGYSGPGGRERSNKNFV
jgi:nucleoside-diphosphate-sugar epimerase